LTPLFTEKKIRGVAAPLTLLRASSFIALAGNEKALVLFTLNKQTLNYAIFKSLYNSLQDYAIILIAAYDGWIIYGLSPCEGILSAGSAKNERNYTCGENGVAKSAVHD